MSDRNDKDEGRFDFHWSNIIIYYHSLTRIVLSGLQRLSCFSLQLLA